MTSARLIIYSGAAALGVIIDYAIFKMETREDEEVCIEGAGDYEHKSRSKDVVDAISTYDVVKLMKRLCLCESSVK